MSINTGEGNDPMRAEPHLAGVQDNYSTLDEARGLRYLDYFDVPPDARPLPAHVGTTAGGLGGSIASAAGPSAADFQDAA